MQKWSFVELPLKGAYIIEPFVAKDNRGLFIKDYSLDIFKQNGIDYELKEEFFTYSKKGVIRALHIQRVRQQPKLVRCVYGHVFDVIVDLRKESPTFKKWMAFDLTGSNNKEILIPAGFAHGYLVLEDSIVSYKCAEKFYGEYDGGIQWNDPTLAIKWPLEKIEGLANVILSEKDKNLPSFETFSKLEF